MHQFKQVKRISKGKLWVDIIEITVNKEQRFTYKDMMGHVGLHCFGNIELCEYFIKRRTKLLD